MQQDAVDCATQALDKFNIEKDIAAYIKKGELLQSAFCIGGGLGVTCVAWTCEYFPLLTTKITEFDKKYSPTWHCIVGRNFGSYVTHETKHFIYFYLGQVAILLFKSG